MTNLRSILECWRISSYQDGWILFRSLLERQLLLWHLAEYDEFEVFDDWCFVQQYEAQNRVRSDQLFFPQIDQKLHEASSEEKDRYKSLKSAGVS